MMGASYKTKKDLKAAVGQPLRYEETSFFGPEYKADGTFCVVGPSPTKRVWYAKVTMQNGLNCEGVIMAHDVKLIQKAIYQAIEYAQQFASGDDGGTCNFDSCYIRVTGMRKSTADKIQGASMFNTRWHGRTLHLNGTLGQGARRTKMAEAQRAFLQANYPQLDSGMYYQMD